jgi:hypothetical protein
MVYVEPEVRNIYKGESYTIQGFIPKTLNTFCFPYVIDTSEFILLQNS